MKKLIFWFSISFLTFLVSIGLVAAVFFSRKVNVRPPQMLNGDCVESSTFPGLSERIATIEKGKSGYFPQNTWQNYKRQDDSLNVWYGRQLTAMKEESLLDISDLNRETYRFLWLRAFNNPVFVRVERTGKNIHLAAKELGFAHGSKSSKEVRSFEVDLSETEWCELLQKIEKAQFWSMSASIKDLGVDGSRWILEGVKNGRYHLVDRFMPKESEFGDVCIYLLNLSGFKADKPDDIY